MKTKLGIVIGAVLALGMAACGDDDPRTQAGELATLELAEGGTSIATGIVFNGGTETQARQFTLRNVGTADLRVDGLSLASTPAGAFKLAKDASGTPLDVEFPYTVEPAGSGSFDTERLSFFIIYTKPADGTPTASLTIASNSVRGTTSEPTRVFPVSVGGSQPRLQVLPSQVNFENVGAGQNAVRAVSLLNQGQEVLEVTDFVLNGSPAFAFRANAMEWPGSPDTGQGITFEEPILVPPGESVNVNVVFSPETAQPANGNLILFSNDPLQTSGTVIPLAGNVGGPCIAVNPRKVNFGGKLIAKAAPFEVEITSCGDQDLVINELFLGDDTDANFDLRLSTLPGVTGTPPVTEIGLADSPVRLAPNQVAKFTAVYTPDEISEFDLDGNPIYDFGSIVIRSNAFVSETVVDLLGFGVEKECPTPVIVVQQGDEVIPQTRLQLIGSQSFASPPPVQGYRWEVQQPVGSQSVFLPSNTVPDPTFEVNVAGTYVFRLTVVDSAGEESCFPAEYTVFVNPDEALHIELLWDTPNDPDQSDEGPVAGADLDLHFAHPFATGGYDGDADGLPDGWFDNPWDTFWYNPHPNWGNFDEAIDDNPGLDRDDTDGAGPENVNLNDPEDEHTYKVGVHYWNDHGFGSSFATLRVYVFSNLVFEMEDVKLNNHDMWTAARVQWPSGLVSLVRSCNGVNKACTTDADCGGQATCGENLRIAPNYVHPFFPTDN